ncbi:MAG: DUF6526 family protein [Gemmatimonadaceae bacterium]|jgi:hypothetical protein
MMADRVQTYGTHRRYLPAFHFFALPVLLANSILKLWDFARHPATITAWAALVAIAIAVGLFTARTMALRAQDRIIRFEERTRLDRLLPPSLRERAASLSTSQLIALRFAPDNELPDLAKRVIDGELHSRADIKRAIRGWRPDDLRV